MCNLFFFFKQKTAYEMRISDWSSDVCSSDLEVDQPGKRRPRSLLLAAQHQLRQPLNALGLLVGDLRQGASGCDLGGRELEGIVADMRYALHLSNTWLDALSDLEAADQGLLEPTLQAVPLQPLFARLQEGFAPRFRSEEHTSELQSLMRLSYA